jgi:hypothetical protein
VELYAHMKSSAHYIHFLPLAASISTLHMILLRERYNSGIELYSVNEIDKAANLEKWKADLVLYND